MKLSTRVELADHFLDDLVAAAQRSGSERGRLAADVLQHWDRATENGSDGALLFYRFLGTAGEDFTAIGGYGVPPDAREPLTTPRGFAAPERAVAALETAAAGLEQEFGTLQVRWGDVVRLRRGALDLPGNGAPNELGAIRTSGPGPFADGCAEIASGDTFYAVGGVLRSGTGRGADRVRQLGHGPGRSTSATNWSWPRRSGCARSCGSAGRSRRPWNTGTNCRPRKPRQVTDRGRLPVIGSRGL